MPKLVHPGGLKVSFRGLPRSWTAVNFLPFNPAASHPYRLAHYSQLHDVQTLAMLCSVFEAQSRLQGCPNSCAPFPQRSCNMVSHSRYVWTAIPFWLVFFKVLNIFVMYMMWLLFSIRQPSFTSSGSCSSMSDPGLSTGGWNIGMESSSSCL